MSNLMVKTGKAATNVEFIPSTFEELIAYITGKKIKEGKGN